MNLKPRKKFIPIATAVIGKAEEREVIDTLRSGWITLGPKTKKFEQLLTTFIGAKHVIAVNSCSAALHLAMLAIGLKDGDEVITTPFTFAATANAIIHCGGRPVFVDIDPETFNIDPAKIEAAINKKTKAILPVHYGGFPADMSSISKMAKKHKLLVVEDAAHAIDAQYKGKKIGTISDLTCFSFHPVKSMTTGDGGAISTNNDKLAEKILILRVNGMDKESWKRNTTTGKWDYAITEAGYKYHMNDLAASLGIHQIGRLKKFRIIREEIADTYDNEFKGFADIIIPPRSKDITHSHNIYGILLRIENLSISRDAVMEELKKYNIGSIVYFRPLHLQPYYQKDLGYKLGDFPNAEFVFERLICLPIYGGMTKKDAKFIAEVLKAIINQNKKK